MTHVLDRDSSDRGELSRTPRKGRPGQSHRWREQGFFLLLLSPTLLIVVVTVGVPVSMLAAISLRDVSVAPLSQILNAPFTFNNYVEVIQDAATWRSFGISFLYVGGTTIAALGLGLGLALVLNGTVVMRRLFRTLLLLPWAIPGVTATIAFLWILNPSFGVANYVLRSLGWIDSDVNWFGSPETAMLAVLAPTAWKAYPFYTVMILAGMQGIPRELYEASSVDGAGPWARFKDVTWPGIAPFVAVAAVFNAMFAFREFDFIFASTRGGPSGATETTAIQIYNEAFEAFQFGRASALGMVVFVILAIIIYLLMRTRILTDGAAR